MDFLLGIPGKLKALMDRITVTRAANLDYLTANVAVASTAVSNADYTSGRAAKLDNIAANPIGMPPIVSGLLRTADYYSGTNFVLDSTATINVWTGSTTFVDAVNYSGSGVLEQLVHSVDPGVPATPGTIEILIDGVSVTGELVSPSTASGRFTMSILSPFHRYWDGANVQRQVVDGITVPFTTSLQIRHKLTGTPDGGSRSTVYAKYRKTS